MRRQSATRAIGLTLNPAIRSESDSRSQDMSQEIPQRTQSEVNNAMNPKRLIEEWLPIKEIGVESRRENSTGQHPPPNRLHVWWARRPLVASRAAILGSLLPAWEGNEELLGRYFDDEEEYHRWFLRMLGILGDPIAAQEARDRARARNIRLAQNPFNYPQSLLVGY